MPGMAGQSVGQIATLLRPSGIRSGNPISVMLAMMAPARNPASRPSNVREFPRDRVGDAELVAKVAAGEAQALSVVWDRYATTVRAALFACLGPDHAIDDLLQEIFLGFYRRAGRIENPSALRSYLLGAAVRSATFERRTRARRSRWVGVFASVVRHDAMHGSEVEANDVVRTLVRALAAIPARAREAFVLRYVDDLSPAEVAIALGVSESTAKRAIAKGRERVLFHASSDPILHRYLLSCTGGRL
jgi:RNA polymerase sigma-70 factor, ECF subfamily